MLTPAHRLLPAAIFSSGGGCVALSMLVLAGDDEAVVCALDMRPTQLRIANYVAIAEDSGKSRPNPEIAFVKDGQIAAEEWGR